MYCIERLLYHEQRPSAKAGLSVRVESRESARCRCYFLRYAFRYKKGNTVNRGGSGHPRWIGTRGNKCLPMSQFTRLSPDPPLLTVRDQFNDVTNVFYGDWECGKLFFSSFLKPQIFFNKNE